MLILFKLTVTFCGEEWESNNEEANILCNSQVGSLLGWLLYYYFGFNIVVLCNFLLRVPSPDSVLVMHTPLGTFSPGTSIHNHQGCFRGSRLVSSKRVELNESSTTENDMVEPLSAARCRVYRRSTNKVTILNILSWPY